MRSAGSVTARPLRGNAISPPVCARRTIRSWTPLDRVEVLTGLGSFVDSHHVQVTMADGSTELLEGDRIYINTGSRPFIPPIPGLADCRLAYTSESMMELEELPERLVVIGGGYIGLEFASIFANFGSRVTMIQDGPRFLPRDDEEVAAAVRASLEERGISIITGARITQVKEQGGAAAVVYEADGKTAEAPAQAILVATGRRPNLEGLNLEAAGVELTARGEVKTDAGLRTSVPPYLGHGRCEGRTSVHLHFPGRLPYCEVPDSGKWRAHHGEPRSGCVQRVCGPALLQSWNERGGGG